MKFEKGFKFLTRTSECEVLDYIERHNMYLIFDAEQNRSDLLMKHDAIQSYLDNQELMQERKIKREAYRKQALENEKAEQEREAEEKYNYEFCYGYCDKMTPMQKAKVLKILNITLAYNKNTYTRKDFVKMLIKKGYTPEVKTYSEWGKGGAIKKKENVYTMSEPDSFIDITKTEYDYAEYLINNKLVTPEAEAV